MHRRLLLMNMLFLAFSLTFGQARKSLNDTTFIQGDTLDIPEVIFDLSHPLKPETNDTLDLVIDFLHKHPNLIIELAFHTDSRGSTEMNQILSENRAKRACDYMHAKMQKESYRVECKGRGENHLIIKYEELEGAKTPEEREQFHEQNRRTEVIVREVK
jgi:outer membrane protein OmpA-like peptidoglycan-associated protein